MNIIHLIDYSDFYKGRFYIIKKVYNKPCYKVLCKVSSNKWNNEPYIVNFCELWSKKKVNKLINSIQYRGLDIIKNADVTFEPFNSILNHYELTCKDVKI